MTHFATMERPINENLLARARKKFLAAIGANAIWERNGFRPHDTLFWLTERWGHHVRRAYDGATGLALASAFRPDVLLLDMLMPGVDGLEVALAVRRQVRLKHCFIVPVTGRTDAAHQTKCYEAGVDLLLIKPCDLSDMQTLLSLESNRIRNRRGGATAGLMRREATRTTHG